MSIEDLFKKYSDKIKITPGWFEFSEQEYFPAEAWIQVPDEMVKDYKKMNKIDGRRNINAEIFLKETKIIEKIQNSPQHDLGPEEKSILYYLSSDVRVSWEYALVHNTKRIGVYEKILENE